MDKQYLTPEGLKKLKEELEYLKNVKRKEIASKLRACLAFGDLTENSEYAEVKEAQGFLEGRILELEDLIRRAEIVNDKRKGSRVQIGSTVLLGTGWKREKFKIGGVAEANPQEGKISADSPLGKALLNKLEGAIIEIDTPKGKIQYKILKIE